MPWYDPGFEDNATKLAGTLFVITVVIVHFIFSCKVTKTSLIDPPFIARWGTLFVGINPYKGFPAIAVFTVFFLRRLLFVFTMDK